MKIIKVKRDSSGDITNVMLDDDKELSLQEAVKLAENGEIENVVVQHSKVGDPFLRSYPNGTNDDNLDNLPTY